jgi:short-subunit dehydrogenase
MSIGRWVLRSERRFLLCMAARSGAQSAAPSMPTRNILITGASSGIGAALALAYAADGNRLALWGRNDDRLRETRARCVAQGSAVETECFDIADADRLRSSLETVDERTPLDLVILNAGIGGSIPRSQVVQDPRATQEMAAVNFVAPIVAANLIAERMARRGHGHIVFVGSVAGSFPLPMAPAYSATKAGLALFAEALRMRLAPRGVVVTLVLPGFVDTPMSRSLTEAKPFLISADAAAKKIEKAVSRDARLVVVPWQFAVVQKIAGLLPRALVRSILLRA